MRRTRPLARPPSLAADEGQVAGGARRGLTERHLTGSTRDGPIATGAEPWPPQRPGSRRTGESATVTVSAVFSPSQDQGACLGHRCAPNRGRAGEGAAARAMWPSSRGKTLAAFPRSEQGQTSPLDGPESRSGIAAPPSRRAAVIPVRAAMRDVLPDSVLLQWTQPLKSLEATRVCFSIG